MFTAILIGILTSTVAEIVTALNKKLQGTTLEGNGAFLIATALAFVGGGIKVFYFDHVPFPSLSDSSSWEALYPAFAQVWTASQLYFLYVTKKLQLDVPTPKPPVNMTSTNGGASFSAV